MRRAQAPRFPLQFRTLFPVLLLLAGVPLAALIPDAGSAVLGTWRNLGPDGGTIRTLAIHPGDPNVLYAGGDGGVFRSTDGGSSWAPANRGLSLRPNLSTVVTVVSLAVDSTQPSTLYAALRADGVARSIDGGATWTHVDAGIRTNGVSSLALDRSNGQRLFAATAVGIYRTGDGGATWRKLTRGLPATPPARAELVVLDPTAPQSVYAVFQEGTGDSRRVFKSTNGGATWRSISSAPLEGRFVVSLAVDPQAPQTLYAGCRNGLLVSSNGGATWRESGLETEGVFSLLVHPTRRGTAYAGTTQGIFRTADGGAHWLPVSPALDELLVYTLAFSPASPRTLFAGTSLGPQGVRTGGVFKSTDASSTWRFSSAGLRALSANILAIDPKNPSNLWLGTDVGLYKSADRGVTWTRLQFASSCPPFGPHSIDLDPEDPETAYLTTNGNSTYAVCATRDGGATWSRLLDSPDRIVRVRVDPLEPAKVYAAGKGVWRSHDRGATWTAVGGAPASYDLFELLVSSTAPAAVYVLGSVPHPSFLFEVLRSTDGGASWRNLGTPSASGFFQSLALDPFDSQTLYSAERGTLRKSVDGGVNWPVVTYSFFPRSGLVHASRTTPGRLHFAVPGDTVYESADSGASWSPLGSGPDHILFDSFLADDPADPLRLYVGTSGGSLLEFTREP
jgi:photosystem II stability/assembly factor-like uncharacterized protein